MSTIIFRSWEGPELKNESWREPALLQCSTLSSALRGPELGNTLNRPYRPIITPL